VLWRGVPVVQVKYGLAHVLSTPNRNLKIIEVSQTCITHRERFLQPYPVLKPTPIQNGCQQTSVFVNPTLPFRLISKFLLLVETFLAILRLISSFRFLEGNCNVAAKSEQCCLIRSI
jgi:hypothetical protein